MKRLLAIAAIALLPSMAAAQTTIVPGRNWIYRLDGTAASPSNTYDGDRDLGSYRISADNEGFTAGAVLRWDYNTSRLNLSDGYCLAFDATGSFCDDGPNTIGQRNGTTTQAFRVYNSRANASDSSFTEIANDGSYGYVRAKETGAGAVRGLGFGAGTGGTVRWKIETTGHLLPQVDNTYSIGSASLRPASVIVGTFFQVGTSPAGTGVIRIPYNAGIFSRNAANSADISLLTVAGSDVIHLGPSSSSFVIGNGTSPFVRWGDTTSSAVGLKRSGTTLQSRLGDDSNYGNFTASIITANAGIVVNNGVATELLFSGASGANVTSENELTLLAQAGFNLNLGANGVGSILRLNGTGLIFAAADNTYDIGASGARPRIGNFGTAVVVGSNSASGGDVRLPHAGNGIRARNAANAADLSLIAIGLEENDGVRLGNSSGTSRVRSSLAAPVNLSDGDWWVECTGTSPTRVCATKVRDGGATRTIASITY